MFFNIDGNLFIAVLANLFTMKMRIVDIGIRMSCVLQHASNPIYTLTWLVLRLLFTHHFAFAFAMTHHINWIKSMINDEIYVWAVFIYWLINYILFDRRKCSLWSQDISISGLSRRVSWVFLKNDEIKNDIEKCKL